MDTIYTKAYAIGCTRAKNEIFLLHLVFLVSILLLSGCGAEVQAPKYPLAEADIVAASMDLGFQFELTSEGTNPSALKGGVERSVFRLCEGDQCFGIMSGQKNDDRFLSLASDLIRDGSWVAVELVDSSKLFKLVSTLFGGFQSDSELFDRFFADYRSGERISALPHLNVHDSVEVFVWKAELSGFDCEVQFLSNIDTGKDYLFVIEVVTNKSVFLGDQ